MLIRYKYFSDDPSRERLNWEHISDETKQPLAGKYILNLNFLERLLIQKLF